MSFKGLRFAGLEWKNITASKIMWVTIAAIAIMPLLYGALYLAAFQDPYGHLNAVPVAVVNEDAGAVIAAEQRNLGDAVVDQLKNTDGGLQWHFVSADEAQRGLADGEYFMTCIIPSDFSQSVASAETNDPKKAQLKMVYNQSENMLVSQIGESVWKEVRQHMSDTVATEYWTTVLDRVADTGKNLQTAADGAGNLASGLTTAQDGSNAITENLGTLKDGAQSLAAGASKLEDGTNQVAGGANQLAESTSVSSQLGGGATLIASKLGDAAGQTANLPAQTKAINDGLNSLVGQLSASLGSEGDQDTLTGGASALSGGLHALADEAAGLPAASAGVAQAATGAGDLSLSIAQLQAAADAAAQSDDPAVLQEALESLSRGLGNASEGAGALQSSLAYLNGSAASQSGLAYAAASSGQLASGSDRLLDGLNQMQTALSASDPTVPGSVAQLKAGTAALAQAAPVLADGIADAASGTSAVATGIEQVSSGANTLASGASQLAAGAGAATDGSTQLAEGAAQLQDGSATLTSGLVDAADGSGELAAKLAEGAQTAADQTGNVSDKAAMMSAPVELVNDYYTKVLNYGTGFAPYLMALGLWVGCLVASFVFKPLNNRLILSGANPVTVALANYLPVAFFSLIQATLLMAVLQFGLQLQIDNVPAFYVMGYLTALVFAAIIQMLMAALGLPGKFVAVILLMLQLTASAGTFPIQTTPAFFQAINPFMPMTYVISGMRQVMTGLNYGVVTFDCFVLFIVGAVCFALTCLVAYRKRTVHMDDLHPVLQLG